jgi:cell division protein FtsB
MRSHLRLNEVTPMSDIDVEEWLTEKERKKLEAWKVDEDEKPIFLHELKKIARLRKRIEELEEENERLRDGLEHYRNRWT